MKIIVNYRNFDIKQSKTGNLFVYSDRGLSEYVAIKFTTKFENVEEAKKAIDSYWEERK